jgi:hypothetical protein
MDCALSLHVQVCITSAADVITNVQATSRDQKWVAPPQWKALLLLLL